MTVEEMLARMTSEELSEHLVLENLEYWRQKVVERDARLHSAALKQLMFRGAKVQWQKPTTKSE